MCAFILVVAAAGAVVAFFYVKRFGFTLPEWGKKDDDQAG